MSGEDSDDKQFDASQKRLEDLRKEGRVPRSPDLLTAAAYAGLLLAILGPGVWAVQRIGAALLMLLDQPDRLARAGGAAPLAGVMGGVLGGLAPFVLLPALAVIAMLVVQRAIVLTPANLMPKLSRISPLHNAGQKFGRAGLFEFAKNTVKMLLIGMILGHFLLARQDAILGTLGLAPGVGMEILMDLAVDFLMIVLLLSVVLGGADYLWQRLEHARNARMSRQEMMDEHKDSEGDPHAKSHRRQKGQEIALNRMLRDVGEADVVIVNPTHYAVALRWDRAAKRAPVCVAKGMDEIAARIRERAQLAGVPIHSDPPTARALHATLDLGDEVRREDYKAVAAAIRFAETMRKRAKRKGK